MTRPSSLAGLTTIEQPADRQYGEVDAGPHERIGHAERPELVVLPQHSQRVEQHEAGEVGVDAAHERPAAKLREGVVAAVRRHDVVPGLGAAVEPHDGVDGLGSGQVVGPGAFALVAVAESAEDDGAAMPGHD